MKTINLFALVLSFGVLTLSCSKPVPQAPVVEEHWKTGVTPEITGILASNGPAFISFAISGSAGGTITNDSIRAHIPANAFANASGVPYNGSVTIKMITIRTIADMIYSGVTTTSGGQLLLSDGMFKLEAYDTSNNPLKLRTGMTYNVEYLSPTHAGAKAFKGANRAGSENKVEWSEWAGDSTAFSEGNWLVGISDVFTWCNLDRFMNETPLTDITVKLPQGFGNTNTTCFLKYIGEVAGASLPVNIGLKVFSTKNSYYKVVQGRAASILCIAKKNNKIYAQVVSVPAITANQTISVTQMIENSEANLHSIIANF